MLSNFCAHVVLLLSFVVYCAQHIFNSYLTTDIFIQHVCQKTYVNQDICIRTPVEVAQPTFQSLL